jgi:hypothetical protein
MSLAWEIGAKFGGLSQGGILFKHIPNVLEWISNGFEGTDGFIVDTDVASLGDRAEFGGLSQGGVLFKHISNVLEVTDRFETD